MDRLEALVEVENDYNEAEFQQNIGKIVRYGDKISLQHVYSQCYLTFNPHVLAIENGYIEVSFIIEVSFHILGFS